MRKTLNFTAILLVLIAMLIITTGCGKTRPPSAIMSYDYGKMQLVQLEELYQGQPIAVITTNHGVIRVALYPEHAPNTVANFIDRINEGFYNNSPVLNIQNEAVFYAGFNSEGQPKTTDDNGNSLIIENEYSVNLWPFKGAIGTYGIDYGLSDSRFFIINEEPLSDEQFEKLREIKSTDGTQLLPDELLTAFKETGCAITFSGFFTIFGQTIEGIEVVEKITAAEVDRRQKPIDEIKIIKIELEYNNSN